MEELTRALAIIVVVMCTLLTGVVSYNTGYMDGEKNNTKDISEYLLKKDSEISNLEDKVVSLEVVQDEWVEFREARCVCKPYSGEVDYKRQYIESYPENRQLTKKQICE